MHDNNDTNDIAEWNLQHDILNPSKHEKRKKYYYYPILHVCINTLRVKEKIKTFGLYWILVLVPQPQQ